jgi:hypothetical protein
MPGTIIVVSATGGVALLCPWVTHPLLSTTAMLPAQRFIDLTETIDGSRGVLSLSNCGAPHQLTPLGMVTTTWAASGHSSSLAASLVQGLRTPTVGGAAELLDTLRMAHLRNSLHENFITKNHKGNPITQVPNGVFVILADTVEVRKIRSFCVPHACVHLSYYRLEEVFICNPHTHAVHLV